MKKLIIGLFLITLNALGEEAFISNVEFSGSGCGTNEAVAILSPDQHVLSLLFDNFIVEAGGELARRSRKNCNIILKLAAPDGQRIVIEKIDYRGYAFLPDQGRMNFKSSYNFSIPKLNLVSRNFEDLITRVGEVDEDLFFEQNIKDRILKRACGEDVELNIRTDLTVISRSSDEEVYVSIDSLDSGIDYHINYEPCKQNIVRTPQERMKRQRLSRRAQIENRKQIQIQTERTQRRLRAPKLGTRSTSRREARVTRPKAPSRVERDRTRRPKNPRLRRRNY